MAIYRSLSSSIVPLVLKRDTGEALVHQCDWVFFGGSCNNSNPTEWRKKVSPQRTRHLRGQDGADSRKKGSGISGNSVIGFRELHLIQGQER
jgi:hypothetical protein